MKSGRGGLVALALLLLANLACEWFPGPFPGPGALPLEEEIRRKTFADDPLATATFRIVGHRHVRDLLIVFYRFKKDMRGSEPGDGFGHAVAQRSERGWSVRMSGWGAGGPPVQVVDYAVYAGQPPAAMIVGQTVGPKVVAVEATFDDGQIVSDPAPDGVFALVAFDATAACELRALDAGGQILVREDVSSDVPPGVQAHCP